MSKQKELQFNESATKFVVPLSVDPILPDTPTGWNWHLLRDIARLESGHTPSRYRPDWWGGDVPWLALPDIRALESYCRKLCLIGC